MGSKHTTNSDYNISLFENPTQGTRFIPEPPFNAFSRGVVYYDKRDGRRFVTLSLPSFDNENEGRIRKNIYVSTYLFAVKLFKETGTLIPDGYQVDHRDNDCQNDTYDNFQLLTSFDNAQKEGLRVGAIWCRLICPVCKKQKDVSFNHSPQALSCEGLAFCCSRDCKIVLRSTLIPYSKYKELRQWISKNQTYQLIRKWKDSTREEIIEVVSDAMLTFDLATASGRSVAYHTLGLLDEELKRSTVHELREQGKPWSGIGLLFGLSGQQAQLRFGDETTGHGVGGRHIFRNAEIIRLFDEGVSKKELMEKFKFSDITCVDRILRTKR